ncbi:trans-sulfuration enzyme family protein [Dethiobacter alkaliphilus]|uniref:trans-sulfuration enzyme family protein n=1 Tax=Dethiobacter alkaliphilus TaxID=427926 RepID=UPI0022277730|nr:PLP-dependent aspartate aminotransferase family protein [Dethiobacter alkaliphilus]MCW3490426.1 PLP-dependent aspartate aminotransferase family protein [Dethiobacter alkaliphilus]
MEKKCFGSGAGTGQKLATRLVQSGVRFDQATGAVSVPIYQSATYRHPAPGETTGFDYTRINNPTREALEESFAALEGAKTAFSFASGMAAITAVMMLLEAGDHVILGEEIYGGTYKLMDWILSKYNISTSYVDVGDSAALEAAILPNTRAVLLESPSNPLLRTADIAAVAKLCKSHRVLTVVDNTLMTPYLQRPLELGADLVVYSATKFLGGHNDLLAGLVATNNQRLAGDLAVIQQGAGFVLSPQESWLLLRGMKTLAVRMDRQQENARRLAEWLNGHREVETVYFPGYNEVEVPGQADGPGAMISFSLKDAALAKEVVNSLQVITFAESLGGVESLITYPYLQTHADMPPETRQRLGIHERLLRLSVGIEDISDLQADLEQALTSK